MKTNMPQTDYTAMTKVPSSIMRKFVYKSGRTKSAQGREPALDYPIAEVREHVKGGEAACRATSFKKVSHG